MCDPLSAAGAAASLGSMVMGNQAQNQVSSARNAATASEAARQQAIQQQQQQLFGTTLQGQTRQAVDQKISDATQKRGDAGAASIQQGSAGDLPLGDTTQEVRDTINNRYQGSADKQRGYARALAGLNSWQDANQSLGTDLARSGAKQAMFGNFSQGSSNILPLELEAANGAGNGAAGIGKLLGAAGTIAGLGGALGLGGEPWFKVSDLFKGQAAGGAYNLPAASRVGPGGLVFGGV